MSELATFGGGCFWCIEAVFEPLLGVEKVLSGYAGGRVPNPSYERVCAGATGHAEVIQVTFDPAQISYRELLELFFAFHDPTTLNAQGPDSGTQYRSIILTSSPEQEQTARDVVAALTSDEAFDAAIVTEIKALETFWPAEEYHQHYYERNPARAYCAAMIAPKMAKLRRSYASRLKPGGSQGRNA
ncbi:MAG TPA: peptide-methionine (S)-S-oxide reductase MsrA [Gemmatimonadales bacterium]|jgi:peptide-methionine (S)-S-oxide reductase